MLNRTITAVVTGFPGRGCNVFSQNPIFVGDLCFHERITALRMIFPLSHFNICGQNDLVVQNHVEVGNQTIALFSK